MPVDVYDVAFAMAYRLLVITEDPALRATLSAVCAKSPLDVTFQQECHSSADVSFCHDAIVIDSGMRRTRGIELCAALHDEIDSPPLIVIVHGAQEAVDAFRSGAADCLLRPVVPEELTARLDAIALRHAAGSPGAATAYRFGKTRVNFRKSTLSRNGRHIGLSELESRLLRFFVEHRRKTISRATLLERVWGYPHAPVTRTVDVHILRLRRKIETDPADPKYLLTVPGRGYRFEG